MKKVLFVFAIAAASFAANAQTTFGVKAGANLANLKVSSSGFNLSFDSKIGLNAGGFATIPVASNINIQPEAVFSMEGAESEGTKFNLNYVNVPVLFQYHSSGFYGETGPQLGLLMSAKATEDGDTEDMKEAFETINLSWAIGAGYRLSNGLGFNARYNLGLSNISKTEDSDEGTLKSNVFQFGLTFTFGGGAKK